MNLLKENGFSIIQGLMLAGLLSGTALVTSRLIADQKKAAISVKSKDAAEELADLAFNLLQHQENCRQTIANNPGASLIAPNATRPISRIIAATNNTSGTVITNQTVLQTNTAYFGNSVSISSMSITYRPHPTLPNHLNTAIFDIRISRNQANSPERTKDGYGTKDFSKKFNLNIQRTASLDFRSCYAVELDQNISINPGNDADLIRTVEKGNQYLAKEFCESLQPMYAWDSLTNTCILRSSVCPPGTFYVGVGSNGGAVVTPQYIEYGLGGTVPINYIYGPQPGVTSTGIAYCREPQGAFNMRDLIYSDGGASCVGQRAVGFQVVGNQIRIRCGI